MANHGEQAQDLLGELGKGRARTAALLDALVDTGYVTRGNTVELTDRGRAAAACVRGAVTSVDTELAAAISPAELAGLRAGLLALWRIREQRAGRPSA
jgi:DNA-binding MarR family transcriptional regulator